MFFTGNISSPVPLQLHSGHSTNVIITMWKEETTSRSFILSTGTEIQADYVMYPQSSSRGRNTSAQLQLQLQNAYRHLHDHS